MWTGKHANHPTLLDSRIKEQHPSFTHLGKSGLQSLPTGDTTERHPSTVKWMIRCPWAERKPRHHCPLKGSAMSDHNPMPLSVRMFLIIKLEYLTISGLNK